jgi:hypothetical protein
MNVIHTTYVIKVVARLKEGKIKGIRQQLFDIIFLDFEYCHICPQDRLFWILIDMVHRFLSVHNWFGARGSRELFYRKELFLRM